MASRKNHTIAIIGRLGGPKGAIVRRVLREVIPAIVQKFPDARILVCGEPVLAEDYALAATITNIQFLGRLPFAELPYKKATLVIGAGRVALEAMRQGRVVLGLGERLYLGPINEKNADKAMASNFGDCAPFESFDLQAVREDILRLLKDQRARKAIEQFGPQFVRRNYNLATIEETLRGIYAEAIFEKNLAQYKEIPILLYHRVTDKVLQNSVYNVYVTAAELEKQLREIQRQRRQTITFSDFFSARLPPRPVMLTFDDGYLDNYQKLLPLLKKYGMKAVVYCLADKSLKSNTWDQAAGEIPAALMNERQIREMAESGHVEIGSHGLRHLNLTALSDKELHAELAQSKRILEQITGKPVLGFCYPYGEHDARVREATRKAGYRFGIAVDSGPVRLADDLFCIRRIQIFPGKSIAQFRKKISGKYLRYRYIKSVLQGKTLRSYTEY